MNRQERNSPEPASDAGQDGAKRLGTVDHHEKPAGLENRERGLNPCRKRCAGVGGHDMRARFALVGGNPNRPGLEEGRIGDDAIGGFGEPGLAARARVKRVDAQDPRLRLKSVARRVALREFRQPGIDLDEIGRYERAQLRQREPHRADPSPDVDNPALANGARRRDEESCVGADPMAAPRLEERERAAEPSVFGHAVRVRERLDQRRRLSHRAILFPGPPRR